MQTQSQDTSPEIEKKLFEHYRELGPQGRFQRFLAICNAAATQAMAGIRHRFPDADEHEIRMRYASTYIDKETMKKAYGWDPGD